MKSLITLFTVTLLSSASMATSGTIHYNITGLDSVSHSFFGMPSFPEEPFPEPDFATDHLYSSLVLPNLTGNFATDKTFQITMSAAEGQQFMYSPPADGVNNFNLTLRSLWSSQMPYLSPTSFVFEWLGATGTAPAVGNYDTSFTPGARFMIVLKSAAPITEAFSFTGFQITMTVPDEFNNVYEDYAMAELDLNFQSSGTFGGIDPGPAVQVQPVPEPSMLALAGLGGLGTLLVLRRRK